MKKKLILNKERITELSREQSSSVKGGGTNSSTERNFTCCWCTGNTGGVTSPTECGCNSVPDDQPICPPDVE